MNAFSENNFPTLTGRWSSRLQRRITDAEMNEISTNLIGFFDTLSSWHDEQMAEASVEVAA